MAWTSVGNIKGPTGTTGSAGANGNTVLNGTSNPTSGQGANGDFFINTATNVIWGPKAAGAWPGSGVSLVGPTGTTGTAGAAGSLWYSGSGAPGTLTVPRSPQTNDMYLDTTAGDVYKF